MRLNLRLLLPIVLVIGLIGGALGTGWFLRVRSRAARAENRGDAFRAQGRAEEAVAQYLAALKHARSAARRQDLALKLADVYEAWPPESPEQAFENAHMALYMLTQVRMMDPANRDVNNKLLDYAFEMARLPNVPQAWQALVAQADHVLEKDPENLLATRYRGIAKVQLMGIATLGDRKSVV